MFLVLVTLLPFLSFATAALPEKIYGVNIGSWLVLEPWMLPAEWLAMGGEECNDCSTCIRSEYAFVQAYPDTADAIFAEHWDSWFNQTDVDKLVELGINTVRIPLGYWIVEPLVDRSTEFYPRGGLNSLKRGLRQLKRAGIAVMLDHHALPGVQSPNQMFAGRCTSDVQFYTEYNYDRALVWTAVMTVLSHVDPDFATVESIEAMNEPIMDASQTPGYGDFQKDFVQVVRAVELSLGIQSESKRKVRRGLVDISAALELAVSENLFDSIHIGSILEETAAILLTPGLFSIDELVQKREPLITAFMDVNWQWNNPSNPADAKLGPQIYDNHLYYSFGGVADPNEEAYMTHICHLDRVENAAAVDNSPLVFGEWGLSTNFPATDEFLRKWADAQKLAYSEGAGWLFWNFKIEISDLAGDTSRQWSYFDAVDRGYFLPDPTAVHDVNVCEPYM